MRVIANAKMASPKDTTCSGFTFGTNAFVDNQSGCTKCPNKNKILQKKLCNLYLFHAASSYLPGLSSEESRIEKIRRVIGKAQCNDSCSRGNIQESYVHV